METPYLIIEKQGYEFRVGKMTDKNYVNITTNFNPIRKTRLTDMIEELDCIDRITCIQRHDDVSGGIAVQLKEGYNSPELAKEIEVLLNSIVL